MLPAFLERESALASLEGGAAFGHRPHRFLAAALGDAGLARRLEQVAALGGHSGAVNTLSWTEGGDLLASGGEDCRLRLWRGTSGGGSGELLHSFDTGHTSNILSACFLPASRGDQLICCSADHQIRHLNVTKGAVRPYLVHQAAVRAVVPLDPHVFLSASEDGTVREFDVRQRPAAVHREALAGDDSNVLVDQSGERVGRSRVRVGIYSLAVDGQRPWMMLTGGTDPLLRLYDRRMLVVGASGGGADDGGTPGSRSGARAPQWVACYAPSHIKASLWDSGRHPGLAAPGGALAPGRAVTAVAFARGGGEVVGSYSGELIYSFDVRQHARDVETLLHIPETVLRAPARPRSHAGRRSAHGYEASQQPQAQWASPAVLPGEAAVEAAAEGGGGTAPGPPDRAAAALAQAGQLLRQQQRAAAGRGIALAPSVRMLERQRRQQSRVAAAAAEPRAESSRPAHWQMHPSSSTLRSPQNEPRQVAPHQQHHAQQQQHHHHHQHHQHDLRQPLELVSDSEGLSDGVSPEQRRQGVRRSRRIMRRRRDAAEAAELQQLAEDVAAEAAAEAEDAQQAEARLGEVQQPAVSGVAEPASSSDSEDPGLHSPATRARRVRRRTLAGAAADEAAAAAAVASQRHEPAEQGRGVDRGAAAVAGADAAAAPDGGSGGFKAPAGRSPQHHRRRQAAAAAAAAAAAMQRLDSTVGLLHHHAPQLEASEVAAGGGGWEGGTQRAQQEVTVSMRQPPAAAAGAQGCGVVVEQSPAMEVSSRPVLSASRVGLATQLGSQQAGHEASSLNSAEQPANERVGSVAQRGRADAPSVGNAPLATTAAAATFAEQLQASAEGREASTGHNRAPPPPPQFAVDALLPQQAQGQLPLPPSGPRQQRQQLQPTASTGTSRPPAFGSQQQRYLPPQASGRQASRLRRHSAGLDASQHGEAAYAAAAAAAAAADAGLAAMGSQAAAVAAAAAEGEQAAAQAQATQQAQQPQATMLSGRGPSVLGDFMPGSQLPTGSEIQQRQASVAAGGSGGGGGGGRAAGTPQQAQRGHQVDSAVGAIVHTADADGGEEVSEPTMFRRRYGGHLNLAPEAQGGLALAPQLAFLGCHSELLVSPSDDGNVFVWDYASGQLVAVLPPAPPAAGGAGPADGAAGAAAGVACVAPHPLLPVLASAGLDATVRLWSPEAEQQRGMEHAAAAARANLERLAAVGWQQPAPSSWLLGGGGGERRAAAGPGGASMHCNTM